MNEVLIVRTGTANTASVIAAFERLGCAPRLCAEPEEIREAARVVLPGVGTFAAARDALGSLAADIQERIFAARPTLTICLGLQLLAEGSEESPTARGLSILPGHARRFSGEVRIRSSVGIVSRPRFLPVARIREAYYANSYRLDRLCQTAGPWRARTR